MKILLSKKWLYIVLNMVFVLYTCLKSVQVAFDSLNTALIMVYAAMVIFYLFAKGQIVTLHLQKITICILMIAFLYQVLTNPVNTPYPFLSYIILMTVSFTPVLLFESICIRGSKSEQKITVELCVVVLLYLYINTLQEAQKNANIVHAITKINYINEYDGSLNVVSFDSSYAIPSLIILLLSIFRTCRSWCIKVGCLICILGLVSVTIVAQYTSVFFLIAICLLVIEIKKKNKGSILVGLCMIAILPFIPSILNYFAQHTDSENVATRLREVAAMLQYGDVSGYNLSARLGMYTRGIIAFLKSPIIGNRVLGFNPHSTFIQIAADIGICGITVYVILLRTSRRIVKKYLTKDQYEVFGVCYLSLILTGCINPIVNTYATSFVVFMLIPLVLKLLYNPNGKKE